MKKTFIVMAAAIMLSITTFFLVEYTGYQCISVDGGSLYGRAAGRSKDLVVLIIAGSGPTDMDGNGPTRRNRNDSLREMSKKLAASGISTFRYDKRGVGRSRNTASATEPDFTILVNDCIAVIQHLKEKGYDRIIVAGHSEGSLIGMLAALKESVDGYVSIAGTGYPIDITLEKQLLNQLPSDSMELQTLYQLRDGKTNEWFDQDHPLFNADGQQYLLTWMVHDPAVVINQLEIPIMLIHGTADAQVDVEDFEALKKNLMDARIVVIEDMNHVLKHVVNDKQNAASYGDPVFPLHTDLLAAMKAFVNDILPE